MQKLRTKSISRQIIVNFIWFSFLASVAFSFMSLMFLFAIEDEFLERGLYSEKDRLIEQFQKDGIWAQPQPEHMKIYSSVSALPDDLVQKVSEEPHRKEFYGEEGRHYHIALLSEGAILVAEVSGKLLIRPLRKTLIVTFTVLLFLLTAIGCYVAYRLARKTILPLTQLADLVEAVDPEKLPKNFTESYPPNEVGVLANVLQNSMNRIGSYIERERHFTRDVSHDLRTPIAVVSGAVEVLKAHHSLDTETQGLVDRIDIANKHMARTVEALLSLAREEAGAIRHEPVRVLPVIEKTIIQFRHFLDGKEVEIHIDVAAATTLSLQPGVLEILLSNILGNAFEYTQEGTVSISMKDQKLSISDTAGGISSDIRGAMFEDAVKGNNSSGFGIGLSIVRRVCEYHNIDLSIEHLKNGTALHLSF